MNNKLLAIITGGSSGIGNAICKRLLEDGYHVINADINPPRQEQPANYRHIKCDVTRRQDVNELSNLVQDNGVPEILILNAGRGIHEKLREGDPEKWIDIINLNICGTLRVLRAILPLMKNGHVIFMSSVASGNPHPYGGIYSATKSAMDTIAATLRIEEQPDIKVAVIAPGVVDTPFFENMISGTQTVDGIGWGAVSPESIADTVVFILSQRDGAAVNNITIRPADQPF